MVGMVGKELSISSYSWVDANELLNEPLRMWSVWWKDTVKCFLVVPESMPMTDVFIMAYNLSMDWQDE